VVASGLERSETITITAFVLVVMQEAMNPWPESMLRDESRDHVPEMMLLNGTSRGTIFSVGQAATGLDQADEAMIT
jgi:hypothetical protein